MQKTMQRRLLIIAGTLSLGLGIAGILIPILPTTPFLLLAAYCYFRSSHRLHQWLLHNRFLGDYVRNYLEGKGMPLRLKILTISLLWLTIGLSAIFAVQHIAVRLVLILIAVGVTIHIILIKTKKDKKT
ncbi:MAG: hypothetical protein A2Z15_00060 [Chloroflexi bacterium RBG_16_50_11]|nr:MAG: hypothetical protein A2Z15_00060 [Chloroflexi bacterium RBG_16_50_11]